MKKSIGILSVAMVGCQIDDLTNLVTDLTGTLSWTQSIVAFFTTVLGYLPI